MGTKRTENNSGGNKADRVQQRFQGQKKTLTSHDGYVQLLTKSRQIWISASHHFPRVSGFRKTSSAIVSKGRASLAPNQKSTVSKVLTTRETPRLIPLSPVKAGRRGAGSRVMHANFVTL